jgi:hypothetical protein
MPDPRSVMKEFRFLDEKRLAKGLTAAEQARFDQLRELVGPDAPPPPLRGGFDVNAAAANLRESLLPAGLRNRPPPTPTPPPAAAPEPEPAPEQLAVETAFLQAPFPPLDAPAHDDRLFDPASLGGAAEPAGVAPAAYDPFAGTAASWEQSPGWDPNAAPASDAAAPAAWDPNAAQAYDPSAPVAAWDPNVPYDPNAAAAGWDPNAAQAYDPSAPAAAWDPNAPYDPNAAQPYDAGATPAWDPNAPYDPNAAQPYDAGATPAWDPNAPYDPNAAQPYDAGATPAWDPNAPYDPNAAQPYDAGAQAYDATPAQPADAGAEAWQVGAGAESWDPNAAPASAGDVPLDAGAAPTWEVSPAWEASAAPASEVAAPPPEPPTFQADAGALPPAGWSLDQAPAEPPPAGVELGEYDEVGGASAAAAGVEALAVDEDAGLASRLPFDAAAASEVPAGEVPEGYDARPVLGEYDDTAGLTAPVPPDAAAEVTGDELGFAPAAPTQETSPLAASGWQPEAVLDEGFQLASGGSFAAGADAAAPEWAQPPATPPWEGAPPLDLATPADVPVAEDAAYYEIEAAPDAGAFAGAPPETLAAGGAAPELDFSQPDFSAEEPVPGDTGGPGLSMTELLAAPAPEQPPEPEPGAELDQPPEAGPGAELEALPPEVDLAPPAEAGPTELSPGPAQTDLSYSAELAPERGGAAEPALDAAYAEPVPASAFEEEPTFLEQPAPEGELAGAPALDLEAPAAEAPQPEPLAFDAAPAAEPQPEPLAFDAAPVAEPQPEPFALEPASAEPDAGGDLTFDTTVDLAEEPPPPLEAGGAAALVEEDIPTLDEADIIEEIADDGAGAPPPQSLDFGPVEPAGAAPAPVAQPGPFAVGAAVEPGLDVLAEPSEPVELAAHHAFELPGEPVADHALQFAAEPAGDQVAEAPVDLAPEPPAPEPSSFAVVEPPPPPPPPAPSFAAPPLAPAPPPEPAPAALASEPAPAYDSRAHVDGTYRVVVHTVEGQVKRGVLQDADLDGPTLALVAQPSGHAEPVPTDHVKAIFFMLSHGETPPTPEGKKVRVTFRDGRQVAGFSPDYDETGIGFFMIPGDTRTNTGRIWVYRAAVRQVAVS